MLAANLERDASEGSRQVYRARGETSPRNHALSRYACRNIVSSWCAFYLIIASFLPNSLLAHPAGLYMFAFTVYPQVHWIVPIILILPFGTSVVLSFTSTFNFFVQTYRPYAASALSSNSFMRGVLAGGLPLASRPMFKAMTNTGALAFLAGVMTLLAPVPCVVISIVY